MPRKPRIHFSGAFYHVTLRGNHRQDIFFAPSDRELLSSILAETIEKLVARVHAYCWMTNHVHLLIQVSDFPLSRLMLRVASQYARRVQSRFHTTGHLFECRYHAVLVDADEYLLTLLRYIHLNPVEARIVRDIDEYPWTSHHVYVGNRSEPWVTTDFTLAMFHSDRMHAIALYRDFLQYEVGQNAQSPMSEINSNDSRILGSDIFVGNVHGLAWKPRSRKTVDQLLDEACEQFSLTREQLFETNRHRHIARARAWIAREASTLRIASVAHIAQLFGRDESTLRKSMQRHMQPKSR
jgi:putative transposase